jgi:hypothetical protein
MSSTTKKSKKRSPVVEPPEELNNRYVNLDNDDAGDDDSDSLGKVYGETHYEKVPSEFFGDDVDKEGYDYPEAENRATSPTGASRKKGGGLSRFLPFGRTKKDATVVERDARKNVAASSSSSSSAAASSFATMAAPAAPSSSSKKSSPHLISGPKAGKPMHSADMKRSTSEATIQLKSNSTLFVDNSNVVDEDDHDDNNNARSHDQRDRTGSSKNLLQQDNNDNIHDDATEDDEALQQVRERLRRENLTRFDNFASGKTPTTTPTAFVDSSTTKGINNNSNNDMQLASELAVTAAIGSLTADWQRLDATTLMRLALGVLLVGDNAELQLIRLRSAIEQTVTATKGGAHESRKSPTSPTPLHGNASSSVTTTSPKPAKKELFRSEKTSDADSKKTAKEKSKKYASSSSSSSSKRPSGPACALLRLPTPVALHIFSLAG